MLLIGTIPAVWLVTFPAVLLPARWGGRWVAGNGTNSFLPHLNADKSGLAMLLAAGLFFVPVVSTLMPGFRPAEATQMPSIDGAVG
jgi:hypothetical protein